MTITAAPKAPVDPQKWPVQQIRAGRTRHNVEPDLDIVMWASARQRRAAERREADQRGLGRWRARGLFVLVRSR